MKCVLIALAALMAVASAGVVTYSSPLAYSASYSAFPYNTAYATPYAALPYAAPYSYAYHAAPAVAVAPSGYVAATRGSLHVAPLPEGPFASSQHINTAPAPGTY